MLRQTITSGLLAFFLLIPPSFAQSRTDLATSVPKSIVVLGVDDYGNFCTGFVVNAKKDYIQTADHCITLAPAGFQIYVDGKEATIIAEDPEWDLAILQAPTDKPALLPSNTGAMLGDQVFSFGHARGMQGVAMRSMMISALNVLLPDTMDPMTGTVSHFGPNYLEFDNTLVPGMSGGPIVDREGRVIAINQVTDQFSGWGRPINVIMKSMGKYWGK